MDDKSQEKAEWVCVGFRDVEHRSSDARRWANGLLPPEF